MSQKIPIRIIKQKLKNRNNFLSFFCPKTTSRAILNSLIISGVFCGSIYVFAANPMYNPGDTLDPACNPTDANCAVASPLTTELEPAFTASNAHGIQSSDITNWNTASGYLNQSVKTTASPTFAGLTASSLTVGSASQSFPFSVVAPSFTASAAGSIYDQQGLSTDGTYYYTFDTTHLEKRDLSWNILYQNSSPFTYTPNAGHFGAGNYYNGQLYVADEDWHGNCGNPPTYKYIAIYNAADGSAVSAINVSAYVDEISAVVVVPSDNMIYAADYCSAKVNKFKLSDGSYQGYITIDNGDTNWQGIAYKNGLLYVDSDQDAHTPQRLYSLDPSTGVTRDLFDLSTTVAGESEGIDYNGSTLLYLVASNVFSLAPTNLPALTVNFPSSNKNSAGFAGVGTVNPLGAWDVTSTTSGLVLPRMTTTQKNAISAPVAGMEVWDTTLNALSAYNGSSWISSVSSAVSSVANSDGSLTISPTTGNVVASIAGGHASYNKLDDGLIAHYPFYEGSGTTTIHDTTGNGYNLTIFGATWVTSSLKSGYALSFPGTASSPNSGLQISPTSPPPNGTFPNISAFTVSAWVNLQGSAPNQHEDLLTFGSGTQGTAAQMTLAAKRNITGYDVYYWDSLNGWVDSGSSINGSRGTWHFLTFAWSNGSNITMYVDGAQASSTALSATLLGSFGGYMQIGNASLGSTPAAQGLQGYISDVRIYSRILSADEVDGLYHQGLGSKEIYMSSTGAAGVGTTAPAGELDVRQSGAVTAANYGLYAADTATSSTASINKYGMYLSSTGTWNGSSANNYGLYIGTTSGGTTNYDIYAQSGAYLDTAGTFHNASSKSLKENYTDVDQQDILAKINQLPIQEWNYKLDPATTKHIGPFAEDFYSIFGVGDDNKTISTVDPAGIALVGIQALSKEVDELKTEISTIKGACGIVSTPPPPPDVGVSVTPTPTPTPDDSDSITPTPAPTDSPTPTPTPDITPTPDATPQADD